MQQEAPVIYQAKSDFNGIVRCYDYRGFRYISSQYKSRFDTPQTGFKLSNPLISKFNFYPQGLTIALAYQSYNSPNILMIGVAGGFLVNYLTHYIPDLELSAVEIDPQMIHVARTYCNTTHPIIEGDGAAIVSEYPKTNDQDIVILDAFNGMYIPECFNNDEFYIKLKENVLHEEGVLAVNIVLNDKTDELIVRIKSHFKYTDSYESHGNLMLMCKNIEQTDLLVRSKSIQTLFNFVYSLPEMMKRYSTTNVKKKPGKLFK